MPESVEFVVRRFLHGEVPLVDLQHHPADEPDEERGRRLAVVEDQICPENGDIPVLEDHGIVGWEANVLNFQFHASD